MNNIKEQARQEAIEDCRYAKSLGLIALTQHIYNWTSPQWVAEVSAHNLFDDEYELAIREIASKLGTPECLLGEEK